MVDSEKGGSGGLRSLSLAESHPQQAQVWEAVVCILNTITLLWMGKGCTQCSQPPILEAPGSSHLPNSRCFLDKASFYILHSIQNP